jgi:hypothetical protein
MTNQTKSFMSLDGSPAGSSMSRLCTLIMAVILATGSAVSGMGQTQPVAKSAKPVTEKKPAATPAEKIIGGYQVHSMVELGGRFAEKSGSNAMWATTINQSTGMRVIGQSLEMHSINPSKTPFFDTLSTSSVGYGGDPNDVSYLKLTKGRLYDFTGSFRRDRNYFDYNLLDNSLLGPNALVPEPDSLHLFNTVRRNTDTMLTLFPISVVHFRAGYNHGTHEGPTYSSVHGGGDVQVLQWFRHSNDTFTGGVDLNVAKRTTLSYDQFFVLYKGDSTFHLAGANFHLADGTPVSLGVDTLATATCGSGSRKTLEVVNGIVNPYCSGTIVQSQVAPTRTTFPTEQLRFSTHYWDRLAMNGRFTYSGGVSNANNFNETFTGLLARTFTRQEIDTGGLGNGRLAHNKRDNVNADYGVEAELSKHFAVSDAISFWDFRNEGLNTVNSQIWAGTAAAPPNFTTPVSSLTPTTTSTPNSYFINQKNIGNTMLGIVTVNSQLRFSGGWRFNSRNIVDPGDDLTWHQNWLLLGTVFQPAQTVRFTLNYDQMSWKAANSATPSNTYTREAPNKTYHIRGRATARPEKWINFAVTGNGLWGKNDDPLVNHLEHNYDLSFAAQIIPTESFSLDLSVARDDAYSRTDLCYLTSAPQAPYGDTNGGTCMPTAANPNATSNLLLGNGYYDAPSTFFMGALNYTPNRYVRLNGGVRVNNLTGQAEMLNPFTVPGALYSTTLMPFGDVQFNIAPQWSWHGNWYRQDYSETGGPGPASRNFTGDVISLSVKYAF